MNLTTEEINNKLLFGTVCKGRTLLHLVAEQGHVETVQKVWEWTKEKVTTDEITNKLLLATDNVGGPSGIWHQNGACLRQFIKYGSGLKRIYQQRRQVKCYLL
jgi:hypothetical protein